MGTKTIETSHPQLLVPQGAMPKLLKGQKALVTAASSGIGKAIAFALGQAGADGGSTMSQAPKLPMKWSRPLPRLGVRVPYPSHLLNWKNAAAEPNAAGYWGRNSIA